MPFSISRQDHCHERFSRNSRRFILFHGKRHPRELGRAEVGCFLEHVAQTEKHPLRCLEEAHESLTFLYQLLHLELGELPFPQPPRLLDRMRRVMRLRHMAARTEDCYVMWVELFIRFHGIKPGILQLVSL